MSVNDATANAVNDHAQIRQVLGAYAEAVRAKDIAKLMSCCAADLRSFDIAPPLQSRGVERYQTALEQWFSTWPGRIGYAISDLDIAVSGDVAFSSSINHLSGPRSDGENTDVWMRVTVGLRKIEGKWLMTHEHVSVPFYMDGSMRAAVDLKP